MINFIVNSVVPLLFVNTKVIPESVQCCINQPVNLDNTTNLSAKPLLHAAFYPISLTCRTAPGKFANSNEFCILICFCMHWKISKYLRSVCMFNLNVLYSLGNFARTIYCRCSKNVKRLLLNTVILVCT